VQLKTENIWLIATLHYLEKLFALERFFRREWKTENWQRRHNKLHHRRKIIADFQIVVRHHLDRPLLATPRICVL
jgi:hypothetical protein